MKISIKVELPFFTWTLAKSHFNSIDEIIYNGTHYTYTVLDENEEESRLVIKLDWFREGLAVVDSKFKISEANRGIECLNFMISNARTFDMETAKILLISPRTVKSVVLIIERADEGTSSDEIQLHNDPPEHFTQFFEYLNEPGAYDVFHDIVKDQSISVLQIVLLIEAYHALYESRFNQSVINCMTAVESLIFPILISWFKPKFFSPSDRRAEDLLIDMPMSVRFELLFGHVKAEFLHHHPKLLEQLKNLNKLINDIIHKGRNASKLEAENCLNMISFFIMILWFDIVPDKWGIKPMI